MESVKTIQIPEGYVIDTERSNDNEIVLRPKTPADEPAKSWEEYVQKMEGKPSVYADYYDKVIESVFKADQPWPLEFADRETLKAYLALGKILKLRKDWVKEWEPDTTDNTMKFGIYYHGGQIFIGHWDLTSTPISFPTLTMCESFANCYEDLLNEAKTLL